MIGIHNICNFSTGNLMVTFLDAPQAYLNFALKLRSFLKNTVIEAVIKETILKQLANREENFIKILKTNVFDNPHSPYLRLFKRAKLTYDDVVNMVTTLGLNDTLEHLYDRGVYITFEEFKGRIPIEREGLNFQADASDFDMPDLDPIMVGRTGGSTGTATLTKLDFNILQQDAKHYHINNKIHGLENATIVLWWGLFPDTTATHTILAYAHIGLRHHY
jgi:hypothetical protein